MTVRTRFAPSPTGELHLGNARTALLNWLVARHHGGAFLLRFEDTDVERNVEDAEDRILDALDWLGLDRDEDPRRGGEHGPYRQSERLGIYRDHAERLLERDAAYHCFCLPEELEARREAALERGDQPTYDGRCRELDPDEAARLRSEGRRPSVRFRVDPGPVRFRDRVRGQVTIAGSDFGDFVILRSDGRPTYNFAVVVDDMLMEISHVIRGVGHLSNTPKQVLLYEAFSRALPEFVHIPLVLAPGGEKLSKREGAAGVLEWRERGFHPDAVVNHLSLLSWSSEGGEEFLTREELIRKVDLDRIGASDAALDPDKMTWLSGLHIRRDAPELTARRLAEFADTGELGIEEDELRRAAVMVADRIQLYTEARRELASLFGEPDPGDPEVEEALSADGASRVLEAVREALDGPGPEPWSRQELEGIVAEVGERAEVSGRALYHPLRAALTGALRGPPVPDILWVLGQERSRRRLREALERVARPGPGDPEGAAPG